MTDPTYTHISVLVDRSGSMATLASEAEAGLKEFVRTQLAEDGRVTFSVFQFDNVYEEVARVVSHDPVADWHLEPRGMTALLDSLGRSIVATGEDLSAVEEHERPGKVIFVIVTDGYENASQDWTREKVFDLIKQQRETYSWEFVFLAANQDAIAEANSMGIGTASNFVATGDGVRSAYAAATRTVSSYRASGDVSIPENV